MTCGNSGSIIIWSFDTDQKLLKWATQVQSENIRHLNFLSIDFCRNFAMPASDNVVVLGADDGTLHAYDIQNTKFLEDYGQQFGDVGQIGVVNIKYNSLGVTNIVIGTENGRVIHYQINGSTLQPVLDETTTF